MKPQIVFILRHNSDISRKYSIDASNSCDKLGLKWEYFEGFSNITAFGAYKKIDIFPMTGTEPSVDVNSSKNKAALCTASHVAIWKKMITEDHECAIILEHDSLMLHRLDLDVPDNTILALGYKIPNPNRYNHAAAGAPVKIERIDGFSGSHAYAITKATAQTLINGIVKRQTAGCIDTHIFQSDKFRNGVSLAICDPIAAIGWIRESTIWRKSSTINRHLMNSFKKYSK